MLRSILLITGTLILGWSLSGQASAKGATDAKIKMVDARVATWKADFLPACAEKIKANAELKLNSSKVCSCIVTKHRNYLVGKVKSGEAIDVPGHLKELLEIYKSSPANETPADDEAAPSMVDLDIDLSASCLK